MAIFAEEAGIPYAPVTRPQDLFDDPHLNAADALVETKLPDGRTGKLPKIPLRIDGTAFGLRRQPPDVGNGTLELLKLAGLGDSEISELLDSKVIQG